MRKVADKVRHIMGKPPGKRDWEVSAILVALVKSEKLSFWGLVKHFDKHPEDLERCELYRPYGNGAVPSPRVVD